MCLIALCYVLISMNVQNMCILSRCISLLALGLRCVSISTLGGLLNHIFKIYYLLFVSWVVLLLPAKIVVEDPGSFCCLPSRGAMVCENEVFWETLLTVTDWDNCSPFKMILFPETFFHHTHRCCGCMTWGELSAANLYPSNVKYRGLLHTW